LNLPKYKYDLHIPLSAVIGEFIRRKKHFLGWMELKARQNRSDKTDQLSYFAYEHALRYLYEHFQAKIRVYKITNEKIEEEWKIDSNKDSKYPFRLDMLELFEIYEHFKKCSYDCYPKDKRRNVTPEQMHQITQWWDIFKYICMTKEYDGYRCMHICPTAEELDAELESIKDGLSKV